MSRLKAIAPRLAQASATRLNTQKVKDPFYASPEFMAWRKAVIARAGGRCQWPGCNETTYTARMFADHVHEIRDGGDRLDVMNGACLCQAHHNRKTADERAKRLSRV